MLEQGHAQKAILDTLERKVKALHKAGELKGTGTFFLEFPELQKEHPNIFKLAEVDELLSALSMVELKSGGRFNLPGREEMAEIRKKASRAVQNYPNGIRNFHIRIRYVDKPHHIESPSGELHIFWLTTKGSLQFLFKPTDKDNRIELGTETVASKLISFLSSHPGFTDTEYLAEDAGTTVANYSREVAKLRLKVMRVFGIAGQDFITGKRGPGYALGNNIKIEGK